MHQSSYIYPIIETHVKYVRPVKFEQEILVNAKLIEYENRLKISYIITDKISHKKLTTGFTTQVAVNKNTENLEFELPQELLGKIKNA